MAYNPPKPTRCAQCAELSPTVVRIAVGSEPLRGGEPFQEASRLTDRQGPPRPDRIEAGLVPSLHSISIRELGAPLRFPPSFRLPNRDDPACTCGLDESTPGEAG